MRRKNYYFVDLTTEMVGRGLRLNESRKGKLTMDKEGCHFTFVEKHPKARPDLRWHEMDRSEHGVVKMNERHVHIEFWIHHDEYQNGLELAKLLIGESGQLGEGMCQDEFYEH